MPLGRDDNRLRRRQAKPRKRIVKNRISNIRRAELAQEEFLRLREAVPNPATDCRLYTLAKNLKQKAGRSLLDHANALRQGTCSSD